MYRMNSIVKCAYKTVEVQFFIVKLCNFRETSFSKQILHWLPFSKRYVVDIKHYGIFTAMFSMGNEVIPQQKTKPNRSRWRGVHCLLGNNYEACQSSFRKQEVL